MRVQAGHKGIRSRLWKCVYIDGVEQEKTLLYTDTYNASKAIYHVGTGGSSTGTGRNHDTGDYSGGADSRPGTEGTGRKARTVRIRLLVDQI